MPKKEMRSRSKLAAEQETALRKQGWITVREAERDYKVPKATIYSWIRGGRISENETSWVGNKMFVSESAVKTLAGPLAALAS